MPRKGVVYGRGALMCGGPAPAWAVGWNGAQLGPIQGVTLTSDTVGLHNEVPKASHQHREPACHTREGGSWCPPPLQVVGPIQGLSLILRPLASQISATKTPQGQAGPLQPQEKGLSAELYLQTLKGSSVQARGSSCPSCQSPQVALSQRVPTWEGCSQNQALTGQLSRGGAR